MDQVFLPGTIRDRIKDLMKSKKMTQAELAVRIGTAESTLSVCLMSLRIFCLAKLMCQTV